MSVYFDTSVAMSLFMHDRHTAPASAWLRAHNPTCVVSSWTATEFSEALAFRERMGGATAAERAAAESGFDAWITGGAGWVEPIATDFAAVKRAIRQDVITLRAPDALHLMIAKRLGLELASLDARLCNAARQLGVAVSPI